MIQVVDIAQALHMPDAEIITQPPQKVIYYYKHYCYFGFRAAPTGSEGVFLEMLRGLTIYSPRDENWVSCMQRKCLM